MYSPTWSGFAYINSHTHTQYTNKCKRTSFILTMQHDRRWSDNSHYSWVTLHGHLDWLTKLFCKQCFLVHPHHAAIVFSPDFFSSSLGLAFFYDDFNIVNDSNDGNKKQRRNVVSRKIYPPFLLYISEFVNYITTWLGYWWICIW